MSWFIRGARATLLIGARFTDTLRGVTSQADRNEWVLRLVEKLEDAVVPVQRDLDRTFGRPVNVEVIISGVSELPVVRVDGNGGHSTEVALDAEREVAVAQVADDVQDELMDQNATSFWPTCRDHHTGLHAEVHDGTAVWWCRVGRHAVASVGELDPDALT